MHSSITFYILLLFTLNFFVQCQDYNEITEFYEYLEAEKGNLIVLFTEECCACTPCVEAETLLGGLSKEIHTNLDVRTVRLKKPDLRKNFGVKTTPSLVFIRDGYSALYDGDFQADSLFTWLSENKQPVTQYLNDDTFEHLTQAATGATTGDWLIAFYEEKCVKSNGLKTLLESVGIALKNRVIVALVDKTNSPETFERFKIKRCPEVIFFRHGKMYKFNLLPFSIKSLKKFAEDSYKHSKAEPVPVPTSHFDKLLERTVHFLNDRWMFLVFLTFQIMITIVAVLMCISKIRGDRRVEDEKKSN